MEAAKALTPIPFPPCPSSAFAECGQPLTSNGLGGKEGMSGWMPRAGQSEAIDQEATHVYTSLSIHKP